MCCDAADPPAADPRIAEAGLMQAQAGKDLSDYMISSDQRNQVRLDQQQSMNNQLNSQYLSNMQDASSRATDQWNFYQNQGRPMVQSAFDDAKNFDSEGNLAQLRGQASADVEQAFSGQRGAVQRSMNRMGVNPGSGRAMSALAEGGAQEALAKVGTSNQMTEARKTAAVGMRQQASNLANGLPASSAQMTGLSNSSAAGAGALAAQGIQSSLGVQGAYGQGMSQAGSLMGQGAGALNSLYGNQLNAWSSGNAAAAQQSAAYGQAASTAAMAYLAFVA